MSIADNKIQLISIIILTMNLSLVSCFGTDNKKETSAKEKPAEDLVNDSSAEITYEDGWTIVSKIENGTKVYWFLAPEVEDVSQAMFKKTIHINDNTGLQSKIVSECEAPKHRCDDLMKQFNNISEKYQ